MTFAIQKLSKASVAAAMIAALAACSTAVAPSGEDAAVEDAEGTSTSEAIVLSLGHVWPENDPQAEAVKGFADAVFAETDGAVQIELFPAGQIGGDRDILEGLELGTTDMWVGGAGVFSAISDLGQFFVTPFMFESIDELAAAYSGPLGQAVRERLDEETATTVIGFLPRGPRHITSNVALENPDDLSGLLIRVPENPMFIETFRALGANPTPMAFTEVFTALQQGTIDGQENPLALIKSSGFSEVQSHVNLTAHIIEPLAIAISDEAWDSLDGALKEKVRDAAEQAASDFLSRLNTEEGQLLADLQAEGMTVVKPNTEAFRAATLGVRETTGSEFGELYSLVG